MSAPVLTVPVELSQWWSINQKWGFKLPPWQPPKSEGKALQCVRRIPNTIAGLFAAPRPNTSHLQLLHYQSHFVESMPVSRPISHKGEQNSNSPQIVGNSIHRQPLSNPAAQITNICEFSDYQQPSLTRSIAQCTACCSTLCEHLWSSFTSHRQMYHSLYKQEGLKIIRVNVHRHQKIKFSCAARALF